MSISNISKDIPSPSAKSANPLRSAKAKSLITPGAFTTLKFSIFSLEFAFGPSIIDVKSNFPPDRPLKKLYSVNKGLGRSEYISKYFFSEFLSFFIDISRKLFAPKSPLDEIFTNCPFLISPINLKFLSFSDRGALIFLKSI